jgi:succinyl-diaminopimelate desuccinylase
MPTATSSHTDTLISLLSHLIRFPTVSGDHATNSAALDWIEQQLTDLPLQIERHTSQGFPSLTATTRRTKTPALWLVAHLDVVPGTPDTYEAKLRDGRLYGRGAHDMKYALAIFIHLLQQLGANLKDYDLGLMVTTDEEVGGFNGVGHLVLDRGYRGGVALVPDCNAAWRFEAGAKGVMWANLTARGRTVHAGRTWEGVNAITEIYRFMDVLGRHAPTEPCGDREHKHPTVNLGQISGGLAPNAVPDHATARIDIRFTPDLSVDDIRSWLQEAAAEVPTVTPQESVSDAAYQVADTAPMRRFAQITQDVTGHGIGHIIAHGSSDARHFAAVGIPTVNVTPTGSGFHIPVEWVDLDDLQNFYEITRRFADDLGRPKAV